MNETEPTTPEPTTPAAEPAPAPEPVPAAEPEIVRTEVAVSVTPTANLKEG